ncbi:MULTISPECIES: SURF1 family protein [Rhizobium]|uniref:SURF1 family protein n=1 Tax=Rhizobium TaxID=379 RepID=UPI000BE7C7E6|nr:MULTISPECIES: SURF1 family protein [Rhizobium]MBB4217662.1 surfeit locus 1 family protein [Rhizobium sp. BK212]MBB4253104.1 surfeit locus 1 family protein [Rhizobium sp. BK008]NKM57656.1 SURF1 family protein [Rhizobium anhuiense]PDS38967.1 cytochrome c oxidase assembly protein [Rhizobium anhuiense]PDS64508.1 cytochrome c oxidase assembly protein [Rhizobium anhuiense]
MIDIDHAAPRRRLPVATGILVLIALAILISLGTWQVERLHWKEGLLADIAERQVAAPVPLADIEAMAAASGDIEYRKVTATGRYINNKERHFFATWRGQTGYYIYTPLELADGRALFVNRGFVPFENKEPEMRMQGQLTDQQTVTGLARQKLPGKPSWVVPDNDVAKNIFYWKDLDVMAESVGLDKARVIPFFVDADSTPNPAGLPIGGVTQVDLPNDHLQYAFTWYGLAAVLVVVVAISWFRRGSKAPPQ